MKALLALEDGRTFACKSFTGPGETGGEIVFNTGMSGYQEVLTDPSYRGQIVTMTYPLIGNYGVNHQDVESDRVQVAGFVVREYQDCPSNFRSEQSLAKYLQSQGVLGITDLDTRALTRHLRTVGALRACISTHELDPAALVEKALAVPSMAGCDLVTGVFSKKPYRWINGAPAAVDMDLADMDERVWHKTGGFRVAAFDFGIKYNILRNLEAAGFQVLVVPAGATAAQVKQVNPDGIFLSNGPGDPEPLTGPVATIRELLDYRPMFGICLGNQLAGLALGGATYKLKFGHRGANQPVKDLETGKIEITSQNHGFAVDIDSLKKENLVVTHINLNDNTLEGFAHKDIPLFTVQYHPEASPGPHDARYLFDRFKALIEKTHA
ncbi:glutamine-hydrolyzing carbamoyl-phosphate synthase small subunit [Desulfosudis oleivorans]|uniref:Carbamoyl phosphate synthase small chain n=1 Tax=Desulfosudis oleivorans (strain DSM 6200 / JCM 39069 / Hxd3) TaxID=96561 RepID=A8ZSL7_DESOH|nr:glutamine-hydrolyzing carbamoyl-phosphate synthase small subunit [Desulfosudis oleivorans]ABW65930.1 carbamoyl-phosphate synthase, small subunit [Desulfosudis oleivorans Hxd3]